MAYRKISKYKKFFFGIIAFVIVVISVYLLVTLGPSPPEKDELMKAGDVERLYKETRKEKEDRSLTDRIKDLKKKYESTEEPE